MKNVDDKLLYRLIVQLLIFSQGQRPELDPYIDTIRLKLKQGSSIKTLNSDLLNLSQAFDEMLSQGGEKKGVLTSDHRKERYVKSLEDLLAGINVPIKFQSHCNSIREKLNQTVDDKTFDSILTAIVSLLTDINKHEQVEQHAIEVFLEDISSQLHRLDEQMRLSSESNRAAYSERETFNETICTDIDNIQISTSSALELNELQKHITLHLHELTGKLQSFKEDEHSRLQKSLRQLDEMSGKITELEKEANTLRDNLKLANAKAFHDSLTGLRNRFAYNERIDKEFKYWKRYKTPVSLLIWDIDHFKRVNDVYGHKAGDKTLVFVAQLPEKIGFLGRYGGEEFVMLLLNANAHLSLKKAETIRRLIANSNFHYNGQKVHITASCGISEFFEGDADQENVFERADRALYQSKKNGRNCCTVYQY